MKVGDKIRHKKICDVGVGRPGVRLGGKEPKRLEFYGENWVIWRTWSSKGEDLGESCTSRGNFDNEFERAPNFFQLGVKYERFVKWSIWTQQQDCRETFEPTEIEADSDGSLVAFGSLLIKKGETGRGIRKWITLRQYDYDASGWTER